jgi:hypothetical protein
MQNVPDGTTQYKQDGRWFEVAGYAESAGSEQELKAERHTIPYYEDAEHFLETLLGETWATEPLIAQTFDDNADRRKQAALAAKAAGRTPKDPYAKVHIGTWEQLKPGLTTLNKNGAGVFLTVNHTVGGRRVEHLQSIRAAWCEWDHTQPPPEWPLAPHIIVESSPNKFHFY